MRFKFCFILSCILVFLISCNNPQNSGLQQANKIAELKKDSLYWAGVKAKSLMHADSIFTGFMDLKWNTSKKEAIKFFKTSKEQKIDFITPDGNDIYLKGSFAGSNIKTLVLTYYNDKLYEAWVDFGYKSDVFQKTLLEKLELKYGNSFKTGNMNMWDFGISITNKNSPKIFLGEDKEGFTLTYISKFRDKYLEEKSQKEADKEKNSVKGKDL